MSENEALESRQSYRARHFTLGAFSTEELMILCQGLDLRLIDPVTRALRRELLEEIRIRRMEKDRLWFYD
jgi:hypothetical protein